MKKLVGVMILSILMLSAKSVQAHEGHDHTLSQTGTTPEEQRAIEEAEDELIEISTPSGEVEEEQTVNYTLPYPGLLPDHPLYFLKSIRDTIIGMLIADPVKKAEFNLLNSDKQLNTAAFLVEKDKHILASSAMKHSEEFMTGTIEEIKKARAKKKDYRTLLDRARTAVRKHEEVLENLTPNLKNESVQAAQDLKKFLPQALAELEEIK